MGRQLLMLIDSNIIIENKTRELEEILGNFDEYYRRYIIRNF